MYIKFGKDCCKVAHLNDADEVKVSQIEGETEKYAKAVLELVVESYPVIGLLYDTVEGIKQEREEKELKEEEKRVLLTGDRDTLKKTKETKEEREYRKNNYYRLRLEGILDYINDNYLSNYYGRIDYPGVEEEDYLDGNNIWVIKEGLERCLGDVELRDRVLEIGEEDNIVYNNDKGESRLSEESIVFVIRTMTLKNHLSQIRVEDLIDDKISLSKPLRNNSGYLFIDFGTDIYVLK